jgi:hypothetical protein
MQFFRDLDWGNWLYGLFYGSIGGGANSVSGALGAVIVDPKHFAFGSTSSFKLMGVIFLLTFMKDASLYLAQKPLPPIKTVTTTETVQQTTRPAATVTTTIEQTQMSANPQEGQK